MKKKMRKGLAVAAVAVLICTTACAFAESKGKGPGDQPGMEEHFKKMAKDLNLTPAQEAALDKQREEFGAKMKGLREKIHATRMAIKDEIDKATPDKAKIASLIAELKEVMGQQIQWGVDKAMAMKQVLTAEQFKKMKDIMEKHKNQMRGKHGGKGGPEGGPRGGPHGEPHDMPPDMM